MKTLITFLMMIICLGIVGCDKYEVLMNMSAESHLLTEEQRSSTLLTGFLVMEQGLAVSYEGHRHLFTEEDLREIADNTFTAPAWLGHNYYPEVNFGWFVNFRVEDGVLVADLQLEPVDDYNKKLADGVRVLYYKYSHRAMLSARTNTSPDGDVHIREVSFVQEGAATSRLIK